MDKITSYIESNDFGELEASVKHFKGKPRITFNYILKSNSKRQRKLKSCIYSRCCRAMQRNS